ncbi:alpha/beta hydrolase [Nocardiopsis sp. MG754419]|nr:alpha/beta hydrolase [Nocardiopsis sp. MG754419]
MVVIGLTGSLVGATPVVADDGAEVPAMELEWGLCPEDVEDGALPLECATLPVPMDYDDPQGAEIEIMVSRLASANPETRRGVLLLNPGGPGAPGLSMPADLASLGAPNGLLDSYDLIGVDTRGVGHSTPVSCGFTADQEYMGNVPPYAVDDAAIDAQAEIARGVAEQCADSDDELIPHLSTPNMARDLDRIRAALGEETASYFGLSYGSALGAAYASLFPERTDRVVLDSNIGDTFLDYDGMRRFALGFEETFPDFAEWTALRDGSYGLGDSPEEVRATYDEIATGLDEEPVAGFDGRLFRFGTFVGLYDPSSYAGTAQMWEALRAGDEAEVRRHLDENGPVGVSVQDDTAPAEPAIADNTWSAFISVTCNDAEWPEDLDTYREGVAQDRERHPMYGAATANVMPCAYWEYEPAEAPVEIVDEGPDNVLIVQNLRDPATPHLGGVMLDERFGDRSRLVSVDASGHGAYIYGDNPCAWNVTTRYLVGGEFPDRDVACEAAPSAGLDLDAEAELLRDRTLTRLGNPA